MKTATRDIVCLEGTYGEPIECNRILSCQLCDPRMIDQLNEGRLPEVDKKFK